MYNYRAKVIRCVDGDTVDFDVDLGCKIFARIRTRLIGVDTPERGQAEYKSATLWLEELLKEQEDEEGYVLIETTKTGKYGRWLVNIVGVNKVMAEKYPY